MFDKIISALENKRNLLITGGAGTGKSYNLRKVIEWADDKNLNIARTAMTGMASLQFDCGETVHRCTGIGVNTNKEQLRKVVNSYKFRNEKRWEIKIIDILIIDEVSMLRSDTIELVNKLFQYVGRKKKQRRRKKRSRQKAKDRRN